MLLQDFISILQRQTLSWILK